MSFWESFRLILRLVLQYLFEKLIDLFWQLYYDVPILWYLYTKTYIMMWESYRLILRLILWCLYKKKKHVYFSVLSFVLWSWNFLLRVVIYLGKDWLAIIKMISLSFLWLTNHQSPINQSINNQDIFAKVIQIFWRNQLWTYQY